MFLCPIVFKRESMNELVPVALSEIDSSVIGTNSLGRIVVCLQDDHVTQIFSMVVFQNKLRSIY